MIRLLPHPHYHPEHSHLDIQESQIGIGPSRTRVIEGTRDVVPEGVKRDVRILLGDPKATEVGDYLLSLRLDHLGHRTWPPSFIGPGIGLVVRNIYDPLLPLGSLLILLLLSASDAKSVAP